MIVVFCQGSCLEIYFLLFKIRSVIILRLRVYPWFPTGGCDGALELARLHIEVDLAIVSQVGGGVRELSVMRRRGLGMSGHFGVISAETVIQATAAVMQISIIWSVSKPVLGISLFLHTHAIHWR